MSDNLFNYPGIIKKLRSAGSGYTKAEADARFRKITDSYTKTEGDGRYARLAEGNTFRYQQIFKNDTTAQIRLQPWTQGYGVYAQFNKDNNTRAGYVGKPSGSSDDMEFRGDIGKAKVSGQRGVELITTTGDVVVRVPTGSSLNMGNKHISNLADPTTDQHATNKRYVDRVKTSRTVNKANITLTRVRINNDPNASAEFCRLVLNNADDKLFLKNALTAKKVITLMFELGNHVMTISTFQALESDKGTILFHMPGFKNAGELNDFLLKTNISRFDIVAVGL